MHIDLKTTGVLVVVCIPSELKFNPLGLILGGDKVFFQMKSKEILLTLSINNACENHTLKRYANLSSTYFEGKLSQLFLT
jgi:hypothetical protein